jgi:hypothetical protein
MSAVHLDDFTLAALALGDLPPAMGADARAHLHGCPPCASRFVAASAEADQLGDPGEQALQADITPPAVRLLEVARPDGGAVLLFTPPERANQAAQGGGVSRLASKVFGRFELLMSAAAGVPERAAGLEVSAGEAVQELTGRPGEQVQVWFGNPHPHDAWLTVLRQDEGAHRPPIVCDGPRALLAGRNAGDPTLLPVEDSAQVVLAVLTRDRPPAQARLQEALRLGLFSVFDGVRPLGQVLCRLVPTAKA